MRKVVLGQVEDDQIQPLEQGVIRILFLPVGRNGTWSAHETLEPGNSKPHKNGQQVTQEEEFGVFLGKPSHRQHAGQADSQGITDLAIQALERATEDFVITLVHSSGTL